MANDRNINFQALFSSSWNIYKQHIQFMVGVIVTLMVLGVLPGIYFDYFNSGITDLENFDLSQILFADNELTVKERLFSIFLQLLEWVVDLGVIVVSLKLVDNQETSVSDLFNNWDKVFAYVVATIIYGLAVIIGLLLLIVPGIYFAIRLQFYSYLIFDKGLNPFEALSESYNLTKGHTFDLFLIGIIQFLLSIVGLMALIVGIIPVMGYFYILNSMIYRSLTVEDSPIPALRFRDLNYGKTDSL